MNDFKYKPSKATWKILDLLKSKEDIYVIQGGQGAGKTISILMILIDHARYKQSREISIISDELSKMKRTVINDFLKIVKDWNIKGFFNKSESKYYFENKSYIEFLGLDVHDVGKGMRRHIVYGNEANKMQLESWTQIASRADLKIIDFNPDTTFWGHDEIKDNNFINLTFLDNEYLGQSEVNAILEYYKKGFNTDESIKNEFFANKWRVYGLGEIGSVEGRIYHHFKQNTFAEFINLNLFELYGVDWGQSSPMGVLWCKYDRYNNTLYCHELNYKSEQQLASEIPAPLLEQINNGAHGGLIPYTFKQLGVKKDKEIICDNNKPLLIELLQVNGWDLAVKATKGIGSKIEGVSLVQSTNIFFTKESINFDKEQKNYQYKKESKGNFIDEPLSVNNHLMDCLKYVRTFIFEEGIG